MHACWPTTAGAATSSTSCISRAARVFVDGRNDMYDQQVLEDYDSIKNADPNWQVLADRYGVDAILLEAGGHGHARAGRGRRLVRAVPRRKRGPLPAQLPLTQLGSTASS